MSSYDSKLVENVDYCSKKKKIKIILYFHLTKHNSPLRNDPLVKGEPFVPTEAVVFADSASSVSPCLLPATTGEPQGMSFLTLDCALCNCLLYFSNILMMIRVYAGILTPGGAKYKLAFMASFREVGLHCTFLYRRDRRTVKVVDCE